MGKVLNVRLRYVLVAKKNCDEFIDFKTEGALLSILVCYALKYFKSSDGLKIILHGSMNIPCR